MKDIHLLFVVDVQWLSFRHDRNEWICEAGFPEGINAKRLQVIKQIN